MEWIRTGKPRVRPPPAKVRSSNSPTLVRECDAWCVACYDRWWRPCWVLTVPSAVFYYGPILFSKLGASLRPQRFIHSFIVVFHRTIYAHESIIIHMSSSQFPTVHSSYHACHESNVHWANKLFHLTIIPASIHLSAIHSSSNLSSIHWTSPQSHHPIINLVGHPFNSSFSHPTFNPSFVHSVMQPSIFATIHLPAKHLFTHTSDQSTIHPGSKLSIDPCSQWCIHPLIQHPSTHLTNHPFSHPAIDSTVNNSSIHRNGQTILWFIHFLIQQ